MQQALDEVLKGRTALVIAHRLSTIRYADKIIALEGGRIREVGDHHELLSRGGLYSQLYRRQIELVAVGQGEAAVRNNKSHPWQNGWLCFCKTINETLLWGLDSAVNSSDLLLAAPPWLPPFLG